MERTKKPQAQELVEEIKSLTAASKRPNVDGLMAEAKLTIREPAAPKRSRPFRNIHYTCVDASYRDCYRVSHLAPEWVVSLCFILDLLPCVWAIFASLNEQYSIALLMIGLALLCPLMLSEFAYRMAMRVWRHHAPDRRPAAKLVALSNRVVGRLVDERNKIIGTRSPLIKARTMLEERTKEARAIVHRFQIRLKRSQGTQRDKVHEAFKRSKQLLTRLEKTAKRADNFIARVEAYFEEQQAVFRDNALFHDDMKFIEEFDRREQDAENVRLMMEDQIVSSFLELQTGLFRLQEHLEAVSMAMAAVVASDPQLIGARLDEFEELVDRTVVLLPDPPQPAE